MNNVKEGMLLACTSQGYTILLVSLHSLRFVLVWYEMKGSISIKFSVLTDTLPCRPGNVVWQTWETNSRPSKRYVVSMQCHMVWLEEHAKTFHHRLLPPVCDNQLLYQEVDWRSREKEHWNKCLSDLRWHLTDDFNVKTVLQGSLCLMGDL